MGKGPNTLLVVSLAMLAVSGCGGDSDTTPTVELTKAAFVKQASAICTRSYKETRRGYESFVRDARGEPFSDPKESREFAEAVLLPDKQRELEELRALGVPSGDEEEVEAILDAYDEGIQFTEEDPHAAITSTYGAFGEASELLEGYGASCRF